MAVDFRRRCRLVFAVFAACVLGALLWIYSEKLWTTGNVERGINKELPLGSTRSEVEMWLDRHEIRRDYYENSAAKEMETIWKQANPESRRLNRTDLAGMVWATIPNVNWWRDSDIDIYFFFDKTGKLVGQTIEEISYAL